MYYILGCCIYGLLFPVFALRGNSITWEGCLSSGDRRIEPRCLSLFWLIYKVWYFSERERKNLALIVNGNTIFLLLPY